MSILLGLVAFGLAGVLTHLIARPGSRLAVLDHPNDRSLHKEPTPTGGGLGIVLAVFAAGLAAAVLAPGSRPMLWIAPGALVIAAISFVDDHRHLSVGVRLLVHTLLAVLLLAGGLAVRELELPGIRWDALPPRSPRPQRAVHDLADQSLQFHGRHGWLRGGDERHRLRHLRLARGGR